MFQSTPTEILKLKTFDAFVKEQPESGNFVILNITEEDVANIEVVGRFLEEHLHKYR